MSKSKVDVDTAISKAFEMQDAGKSDEEIMDWIDKQPNKAEIDKAFQRMVEAFSSPKYLEHIKTITNKDIE